MNTEKVDTEKTSKDVSKSGKGAEQILRDQRTDTRTNKASEVRK